MGTSMSCRKRSRKGPAVQMIEPGWNQHTDARIRKEFFYHCMSVERIAEREHVTRLAVQDVIRRSMWPGVAA